MGYETPSHETSAITLFPALASNLRMLARNYVPEVLAVPTLLLLILSTGCGAGGTHTPPPASAHVFLVVEENHSFSQVMGNGAMPYLNSLAGKYGLATQYYADVHPSIGNYFMLTTGQPETLNELVRRHRQR